MATFTIVVPAFNAATTLGETLDAIGVQAFADWECLIVDDGSTDETPSIARRHAARDPRFRVLSQPNAGTAGAYNTGVAAATGDLIVICSADDLLLPDHLATMDSLALRCPEAGIYSCNGEYLGPEGARRPFYEGPEWLEGRSLSFEEVLGRCFFSVGATYRREVFDLVGGYRTGVYGEDYDFWLRAMARGVTQRYTPEVLALHRVSASQKSSDLVKVLESDIAVFGNLIDAGLVHGEQVAIVERALEAKREALRAAARGERVLAIRTALSHVIGRRAADAVMDAGLSARRALLGRRSA